MLAATVNVNYGATKKTLKTLQNRLARMLVTFQTECQKTVGVVNPPPYTRTPKGDPPRVRTRWGQAHILFEIAADKLSGRVGVGKAAFYMAIHENKQHPWLLATLKRMLPRLQQIARGQ